MKWLIALGLLIAFAGGEVIGNSGATKQCADHVSPASK
jgi:hypothetical protein